ncbi:hypothetical protein AMST5_00873 [freshwater sediment metagenome]|uniref:Uncharacterized protein n=1 Tax=freshwater sediment metagenome TaxID=556182 RepID=A0AA48M1G1_9ZZZZ
MLTQIGLACDYAKKFNRLVIVQTNYHPQQEFGDTLSNYFYSTSIRLLLNPDKFTYLFDSLTVYPNELLGRVNSYVPVFDPNTAVYNYADELTGVTLTFDFAKDYAEKLLVHHACGCQPRGKSITALSHMQLHPSLAVALSERLSKISSVYDALHIRNTDYRSLDYIVEVNALTEMFGESIFVATDNRSALDYCRDVFGTARVYSFSSLPSNPGDPLHKQTGMCISDRNSDAVLDLMMLALSRKLHACKILNHFDGGRPSFSGFSMLASDLQENRELLKRLVPEEVRYVIPVP